MLSLLPAFLLVFLSFPLQSFSWASIPQTDPQFQRQFSSDFQIKIPRSRQSQTDGFFSENTSSGPEGDSIYTLYNYRNIDYQNSDIKKVVIQIAGQGRDAWSYFDDTLIALKNATARDESAHRGRKKSPTSTKSTSRNRSSSGSSSKKSQSNSRTRSDSSTRTSTRRRSSTSTSSPEPTSTSPSPSTSSPGPTSTSSSSTSTVDQDSNVPTLKESEVLIFCPMFMNLDDAGSYPISNPEDPFSSTSSALAWNVDDWIFGGDSILPNDYFWSGDEDEEQNSRRRRNQEGSESLEKRNVEKKSKTEFGRERDFEDGSDIRNSSTTLEHDYVWREDLKLNSTSSSSSIKRQTNPPPGISSFEVMDELIRYFSNSTSFPNLQTIIISGHSAGGQFVQRYALVGAVPSNQIPVHFTILNPGSYAYLTNWRAKNSDPSNIYTNKNGSTIIAPVIERSSNNTCDDFNDWKYGIGLKASDEVPDENLVSSDDNGDSIVDFGDGDGRGYDQRYLGEFVKESLIETNDVKSIVLRYGERIIHYLYGTDDHGVGSDSCMAMIQGVDHLSRGLNFIRHLTELKSFESLKNDADADDGDYNVSNSTNEAIEQNQTSKAKSNAPDNLSQIPAYMRSMVSSIGPGNGNFPSSQTVDYVPGVQHNPRDMFLSKQGLQRLFFINLDGEEIPKAVGDADKDSKYFYPNEATSSRLGFFKWIPVVALTASVSFLVL